jgi:hypothetical protein
MYIALGLVLVLIIGGGVYAWSAILSNKLAPAVPNVHLDLSQDTNNSPFDKPLFIELDGQIFPITYTKRTSNVDMNDWKTFVDQDFAVTIRYPGEWDIITTKTSENEGIQDIIVELPNIIDDRTEYLHAFSIRRYSKATSPNIIDMIHWMYESLLELNKNRNDYIKFHTFSTPTRFEVTTINDKLDVYNVKNFEVDISQGIYPIFEDVIVTYNGRVFMILRPQDQGIYQAYNFTGSSDELFDAIISSIESIW